MNAPELLPPDVAELIKELIKRPDVQSVSMPYADEEVWRALVVEQLERAQRTGLHRQHAFSLSGPDGGLPFDPADWGGSVHIPYEGAAEADLFVKPPWYRFRLASAMETGSLTAAIGGKQCHHLFLEGEHQQVDCASRLVVQGWTLYTSNRPYRACKP